MSAPAAAHSATVTARAGTRTATVDVPDVTSTGTPAAAGSTMVSGPGPERGGQALGVSRPRRAQRAGLLPVGGDQRQRLAARHGP